jgi:hypothetical protein
MVDFNVLREGMSLGDAYTLEHFIRHDPEGAFFAVLAGDGEQLLVKLVSEQHPEAERRFDTWQRSRQLRHPHLLHLRDTARCELAGDNYIYGVFEYPDDILAQALEQGPLSEPETRGVLEAVVAALRYLHSQGMVHGAVDPDHIVAVGDNVKLATDALRESDDLEGHPEDVRQLGELVRGLRFPEPLSDPLAIIARHATAADPRQRWTLAEIARVIESAPTATTVASTMPVTISPAVTPVARAMPEPVPPIVTSVEPGMTAPVWSAMTPVEPAMQAPVPPVVIPVEPVIPASVQSVRTSVEPAMPASVPPVMTPAEPVMPASFPRVRGKADASSPEGFPKWIIAGVAILLFFILILNLRHKRDVAPDIKPAIAPVASAGRAAVRPIPPPAATAQPSSRGMWRVIAFTFRSREMAAKKAKQIDARWPGLRAAVFAPKGRRGYYLVALGNGMNREEATRVQHKARSLGLPHDTYVQNYSE